MASRKTEGSAAKRGAARLDALRTILPAFADSYPVQRRLEFDPIEFPRRFAAPEDIEVVALISACLAYGRASLFKPRIQAILDRIGKQPAEFARCFARDPDAKLFQGISYRFNQPEDFAALVAAIGWVSAIHGSLGKRFGIILKEQGTLRAALAAFADDLRDAPPVADLLAQRGHRGLRHLVSDARLPGACKRLNLYLRWMVRGPDEIDFGIWKDFVKTSELVIPLDTHIARISRYIGLTHRTDLSWTTAEEVTASLRRIDPSDAVRFDFYLCHHGMSGACPPVREPACCSACRLRGVCRRTGAH
jgi:uncharacterized protein (TIGR02757 family)